MNAPYRLDYIERTMSESERSANGRRDFLKTLIAAPGVTAALVETAQAAPLQRDVFVKHAYQEHTIISAKS